jgi:single-strand DNA-binding protein
MLNKVTIMGRLCADPELRRTQSGIAVCNARIAVERDFADQSGERATDFFDAVAWRGTAEFLCKYFEKGRKVLLDGRLQTRQWTDRDGNKRVSVEIVAESVYFADSKPAEAQGDTDEGQLPWAS